MRRSRVAFLGLFFCALRPTSTMLQQWCGGDGRGGSIDGLAKVLSQAQSKSSAGEGSSDFFDGRFVGGNSTIDPTMLQNMQQTLRQSLTPELQDSMRAMMEGLRRGDGLPQMGMMAFGVGENEKGKRVARGAKLSFDPTTGRVSKDFVEKQLEEDDPVLPRETTEDYSTNDAIEVEFVDDGELKAKNVVETIAEAEVINEGPNFTRSCC